MDWQQNIILSFKTVIDKNLLFISFYFVECVLHGFTLFVFYLKSHFISFPSLFRTDKKIKKLNNMWKTEYHIVKIQYLSMSEREQEEANAY